MANEKLPEEPAMREIDEITDYDEDTSETNSTTGSGTSDSEDSLDTNTTEMEGKGQDEEEKETKESLKAITLRSSSRLQEKMKMSPGGGV
jgi:phosphatidate phosphatase PAH1